MQNVILGNKMRKNVIRILFSMFFKPVYFIGLKYCIHWNVGKETSATPYCFEKSAVQYYHQQKSKVTLL